MIAQLGVLTAMKKSYFFTLQFLVLLLFSSNSVWSQQVSQNNGGVMPSASILQSLKKTNRIVFIDEDVPGGAAGYMFNQVMEEQGGYKYLDVAPRTITAKAHRPSYGSDGDYFSKPNVENVVDTVYEMMREVDPTSFPAIYF